MILFLLIGLLLQLLLLLLPTPCSCIECSAMPLLLPEDNDGGDCSSPVLRFDVAGGDKGGVADDKDRSGS